MQSRSVPIAGIQMVSGRHLKDNLLMAADLMEEAASKNAQLMVLPENFSGMGLSKEEKIDRAEKEGDGPVQSFLLDMAVRHRTWIVGSVSLKASNGLRNSMLVFDPSGVRVARYDKMHLFQLAADEEQRDETSIFEPGEQIVAVDTPFGRMGLSICYDIRFPELYRSMDTLDLIVVGAAFTELTGEAHWEVLLRARAIENHCYLLAAAQGGKHPDGTRTFGNSMMIDPWGNIIDSHARGEGIVAGWLDHGRMQKFRRMLPNQTGPIACHIPVCPDTHTKKSTLFNAI